MRSHHFGGRGLHFQSDVEIVTAAVTRGGGALKYASAALQTSRQIVLAAMVNDGTALEHADNKFRKDREVVSTAVRSFSGAFLLADQSLKNDPELYEEALGQSERQMKELFNRGAVDKELTLREWLSEPIATRVAKLEKLSSFLKRYKNKLIAPAPLGLNL